MIAIIPARGGSKGVPGKNIRMLAGKPLILWTIEAALKSKHIDRIILSTDSSDIAEVCKNTGVEIPFMRPKELAMDTSVATDAYLYTLDRLNAEYNFNCKEFVVLHPTSPLRLSEDIDSAIELFYNMSAESVISCYRLTHPPFWTLRVSSEGTLKKLYNFDISGKNRQEVEPLLYPNGAVTILNLAMLREKRNYYSGKTFAYIMPQERSLDIDTQFDFYMAELLIRAMNGH